MDTRSPVLLRNVLRSPATSCLGPTGQRHGPMHKPCIHVYCSFVLQKDTIFPWAYTSRHYGTMCVYTYQGVYSQPEITPSSTATYETLRHVTLALAELGASCTLNISSACAKRHKDLACQGLFQRAAVVGRQTQAVTGTRAGRAHCVPFPTAPPWGSANLFAALLSGAVVSGCVCGRRGGGPAPRLPLCVPSRATPALASTEVVLCLSFGANLVVCVVE